MSCEQAMVQALKESGQRLTPQRIMILTALRHANGHITASEIRGQVKETYPYIDISTVYRTLSVLKQVRLASETDMGDGEYRYEWIDDQTHHHLICQECDNIILLDHRHMETLGAEILDGYGFHTDMDHIAIFGLCKGCRLKARASQTTNGNESQQARGA